MSGTVLIAAAVVVFVLLVSVQAVRDWPLSGLVGGGDDTAVTATHRNPAHKGTLGTASGGAETAEPGAAANRGSGPGEQQAGSVAEITPISEGTAVTPAAGHRGAGTNTDSGGGGSTGGSGGGGLAGSGSGLNPGSVGESVNGAAGEATSGAGDVVAGAGATAGGVVGAATGGGVGHAAEEVVGGVAGQHSAVGGAVGNTVKTVTGLLGPGD